MNDQWPTILQQVQRQDLVWRKCPAPRRRSPDIFFMNTLMRSQCGIDD
jgi:hypothetical protein